MAEAITIDSHGATLRGELDVPEHARGLVLFAHGGGSSRNSPRNRVVAAAMRAADFGTLLFDLLTPEEQDEDRDTGHLRFDVDLLAQRLEAATERMLASPSLRTLPIGYFGASTGAAAALIAAARVDGLVEAVVARGGRPDLAGSYLSRVTAPTLLVVGERDTHVLELNSEAYARMRGTRELVIVPGASHLFEEPGALGRVAALAVDWFRCHIAIERRVQSRGSHLQERRAPSP